MKTPTIERNPDVKIGIQPIPEGCYVHEGKLLPQRAKSTGIPFGVAVQWLAAPGKKPRWETIGLVIRNEDHLRMTMAAKRAAKKTGKGKALSGNKPKTKHENEH